MKSINLNKKQFKNIIGLIIFIAFILQSSTVISYISFGPDNLVQSIIAKSFSEGHGFSIPHADPKNLSKTTYIPFGSFPPGFSILLSFTHIFTNSDLVLSIHLIFIISLSIFFFITYKTLNLYKEFINPYGIPVLFAFLAVAFSPFKMIGVTGLLSLNCYLISMYIALCIERKKIPNKFINLFFIALFSFLCSFFRFSYYTQTFVVPIIMLIFGLIRGERTQIKDGVSTILITIILFSFQIIFQKINFSSVNWLESDNSLLHFENLLVFNPLIINTFFNLGIMNKFFSKIDLSFFIFSFTILFIIAILFSLFKIFLNKRESIKEKLSYPINTFIIYLILSSLAMVFFLVSLSVIYPSFSLDPSKIVSYVSRARYFSVVIVFLIWLTFIFTFFKSNSLPKYLKYFFGTVIILSFLLNASYWLIHTKKITPFENNLKDFPIAKDCFELMNCIKNNNAPVVIVRPDDNGFLYWMSVYGGAKLILYSDLKLDAVNNCLNSEVWIPIKRNESKKYVSFLSNFRTDTVKTLNNINCDVIRLNSLN